MVSSGQARPRGRLVEMSEGARVTPLELFFDLVFVYAFTQVSAVMEGVPGIPGHGVLRGLLVLAVLWWAWSSFAWLGNTVRADEGVARLALFGVIATMFVAALTIPEAFDDQLDGLGGPVVFVACYAVVRILNLLVYWHASRGELLLRGQVVRAALPMACGVTVLFAAALDDHESLRTALWAAALVLDYGGSYLLGAAGARVNSAAHWAERHSLIIIIALGESVVAIGVGVGPLPISWPVVVGAVLGIAVTAALWWAYFDVAALHAERVLHQAFGAARAALARDAYTYLHLPMVAGIILLSLGMSRVLNYVGGASGHRLSDPLRGVPLYAMYGGVVLYLLGDLGFRLRTTATLSRPRVVAMIVLIAVVPLAARLPALGALALLAAALVGLVGFEMLRYAEARLALREAARHDH